MKLSEIARDGELVKLESAGKSYFTYPNQIYIGNEYIVITDHGAYGSKLFIFRRDGNFHTLLNKTGKGPGEYLFLQSFAVSPDESQIAIGDPRSQRLIAFDMDGKFIKETSLKNP